MIHHPLVVNEGRTIRDPCCFVPFLFSFGKGQQIAEKQSIFGFVLFLSRQGRRKPEPLVQKSFDTRVRIAGLVARPPDET
jgi:hypothetical protein